MDMYNFVSISFSKTTEYFGGKRCYYQMLLHNFYKNCWMYSTSLIIQLCY